MGSFVFEEQESFCDLFSNSFDSYLCKFPENKEKQTKPKTKGKKTYTHPLTNTHELYSETKRKKAEINQR